MENQKDIMILRHSAAHLAAQALTQLYPNTKLTIGPATEEGFFYDVLPAKNFKEEDLEAIEKKMKELSEKNYKIEHKEITKSQAKELFKENPFKLELIDQIPGETVGLAIQGDFVDLCRGGHVKSTAEIKFFKLTGISGSYWRADKANAALQRIHGVAFFSQKEMDEYQKHKEELQKYDHRRLGKQMDLFSFHEEGIGFPFFHPKGKTVLNVLESYMRQLHRKYNYQEVSTPTLLNDELWKRSGHWNYYKDNMYFTNIDEHNYAVKPMNCPGSFLIFKNRPRSYRELPLKLAEFGHVHRHELSGVLHGLLRVRAFTQDDAHIYCSIDQVEEQVLTILNIAFKVLNKCEFKEINIALSTKPKDAMFSDELWSKATDILKNALNKLNVQFFIKEGEGAFYGPKIEILVKDSMNREWQCGTIQIDFFQAENFDLSYVSSNGKLERPVIIHSAIYGSFERFFAILLEHFKGQLPFWLAPEQIRVLTITDEQKEYGQSIVKLFNNNDFRITLDHTSDPISAKIKNAQLDRIPWMFVIGKKEVENNTITLRFLTGQQEFGLKIDELIDRAKTLNSLS